MSRRSERTGRINERDFPHLVELLLPSGGFAGRSAEMRAFHRQRGIKLRYGQGRIQGRERRWHVRFCFADPSEAEAFRHRFGGERLTYQPKGERF